ncbi:19673_t:CDS:2, partial [Rhizophagus irregularis]
MNQAVVSTGALPPSTTTQITTPTTNDSKFEYGDENPITAALTYETIKKLRKPKCVRGQLVVEWKKQKNTDFN